MASTDSSGQIGLNGTSDRQAALSAAQKLMQKHHDEAHKATIEEVPDEEDLKHGPEPISSSILESTEEAPQSSKWGATMSAKSAGKQKEELAPAQVQSPLLDTQSNELFPGLGGAQKPVQPTHIRPSWVAKPAPNGPAAANGKANGISTSGSSTPQSGINTPPSAVSPSIARGAPQSLAGQVQLPILVLQKQEVLPRNQLKKPLADILKDINKKLRTNITVTTGEGGVLEFRETSNQKDAVRNQAIKDLGAQIGAKTSSRVPIPRSARAHIIGKQGSTIKSLQESTGARIQMPKLEDTPTPVDEDDDLVDVIVEGNPIAIAMARRAIAKIANERIATVNTKLRTIPAEFYPFIAGAQNTRANALEEAHGVQIRVPPYHTWTSQRPPQQPLAGHTPAFLPAAGDNHISVAGDRAAVQAARAEIERLAEELRQRLALRQISVDKTQHQYVIGKHGITPQDFFAATGCAIVVPGPADEEMITFIGPADRLEAAENHALDLATSMQQGSVSVARQGNREHARNITQYLRDRREIERLERLHQFHIATPPSSERADTWNIFFRDGKNAIRARTEISGILDAHPPSRVSTVGVDPFFHAHLRKDVSPRVKKDYGVHLVIPEGSDSETPVILVVEGENGLEPEYQVPRGHPSPQETAAFQQGLQDARNHIMDILSKQADISSTSIDVPQIFHEKLRKFIYKEQTQAKTSEPEQIPVRVTNSGTVVTLRGPSPAVEALAAKVNAFIEQAKEDEKERDFTMSFEFPQKHANQLIGKGGSNIKDLRERFDVAINVNDGSIELKGPKAKAEAAKSHITTLGRQWADEATYVLKVDPKYHRELIGAQGAQINKLQTRYKVQIHFPRPAKSTRDDQSNADAASEAGRKGSRREQEPDEVIVKGPKKGADEARDEILSLLQYYKDNSYTSVVAVQASQIPSLIGKSGSGMDEIRQTTGARIDIPNARDIKDSSARVEIQIKGTKAQVAQAKKLIEEKRDLFDQTVTKTLEVDKKHHRALIGAGGSALRDIVVQAGGSDDRRELARTVQFPKAESDGNVIKVEGKADVVDKIIAKMNQIVLEKENQTTETIEVPTDKHRSLIGRGGETKKELESKFKVSIDIPRQGNGQTGVKIVGLPADVEKAKTHILDLVKDQEGETVQVPRKVHHNVADNGQFFRRLRNDHQVTVDHAGNKVPPKPAPPSNARASGGSLPLITDDADDAADVFSFNVVDLSDSNLEGEIPWILRGPPNNLAKARALLDAAIEQALKTTTTGYLVLPDPRTYRYVIGQGGNKVNSIRKATGCKITVPRDQAKDEAIEIVGSAEGVEKAKDLILKAVKDGNSNSNGGSGSLGGGKGAIGSNGNANWD